MMPCNCSDIHAAALVGLVEDEQHTVTLAQQAKEVEACHVPPGVFQLGVGNHKIVEGICRHISLAEYFLKNGLLGCLVHHLILLLVECHALCFMFLAVFFIVRRPNVIGFSILVILFNDMVKVND